MELLENSNSANNVLDVRDLTKEYDGKEVLKGISFSVREGEFLSILGPSGCGKTTTLRLLIGLEKPTSGIIESRGNNLVPLSPADRGMGIVFQDYALFENMTVFENVEYAMRFREDLKSRRKEIATGLLEQVGLGDCLAKHIGQLSGGQQQRVSIARTLALNPRIILFDEPMSALDVETRLSLRDDLKLIQERFGTTMIYITHDQEEALTLSDRIMVMGGGSIHQIGTPEELLTSPADDYVRTFVVENLNKKIGSLRRYMRCVE